MGLAVARAPVAQVRAGRGSLHPGPPGAAQHGWSKRPERRRPYQEVAGGDPFLVPFLFFWNSTLGGGPTRLPQRCTQARPLAWVQSQRIWDRTSRRPDPTLWACGGERSSRPSHKGEANCGRPAGRIRTLTEGTTSGSILFSASYASPWPLTFV